ncbi:MAG: NUMOD3 domain-containing DNA-binding protein [archaeon]|nr:NUMOD3 domain-containing DNA-binding protein [archaeon]
MIKCFKHSDETKKKISNSLLKNPVRYWLDKKRSEESKLKMSLSHKGIKLTEETRRKISESNKGKTLGSKLSDEQKIKLSNSHKNQIPWIRGKHHSQESKNIIKLARSKQVLPVKDSSIEVKLQSFLKELNITFIKHKYIKIDHAYCCDIFVPHQNLILEADGNFWHKYPTGREIDRIRTKELLEQGFKVLRLWESEINNMNIENFKEKLFEVTVK